MHQVSTKIYKNKPDFSFLFILLYLVFYFIHFCQRNVRLVRYLPFWYHLILQTHISMSRDFSIVPSNFSTQLNAFKTSVIIFIGTSDKHSIQSTSDSTRQKQSIKVRCGSMQRKARLIQNKLSVNSQLRYNLLRVAIGPRKFCLSKYEFALVLIVVGVDTC